MPIRPSSGAGYRRRPADALWGTAPRYSRRQGARPTTHDDLMPAKINSHHLTKTSEIMFASRRDYLGSYDYDGRFIAWLEAGPLPKVEREQRRNERHPTRWHESPYLVARLEANLGRDGVRAVLYWYALRARFEHWYAEEWDGEDAAEVDQQRAALARAVKRHAATCCGGGHDERWLERLADKIQRHVWKTYYPNNRQRRRQDDHDDQDDQEREARTA